MTLSSFHKIIVSFVIVLIPLLATTQTSSDCECEDEKLVVCYLSDDAFCSGFNGCGYTLDGSRMDNYLVPKLENQSNFGTNGVVSCEIVLSGLNEVPSVDFLIDRGCDIIFTGNFIVDTLTNQTNPEASAVPYNMLDRLHEWSQLCPTNLVITSQAESHNWGYDISNQNQNPNISSNVESGLDIFNGPFGLVNEFFQGGTYQGIISTVPNTGATVLAVDQNGNPTVVLDSLTNDIIFGDIGIFCGGGAVGQVSEGPNVINSNDRLVCNIFALGCAIASAVPGSISLYEICPDEIVLRPGGIEVNEAGTYLDTLLASNNCDSIVTTIVSIRDTIKRSEIYEGCIADKYFITVNDIQYDETNPFGIEYFKTQFGCDSIVLIDLKFDKSSDFLIDDTYCANEPFEFTVGNTIFNASNLYGEVTLTNIEGCDSIVTIDLSVEPLAESFETFEICPEDFISIDGNQYGVGTNTTLSYSRNGQCDSLYSIDIIAFPSSARPIYPTLIAATYTHPQEISITTNTDYIVNWVPSSAVSCSDCTTTQFLSNTADLEQLEFIITDNNNCSTSYFIDIEYTCPVYIPNVISTNSSIDQNAALTIGTPCGIDAYQLEIYDRWGSKMFQTIDMDQKWDGTFKGSRVVDGVYIYVIKIDVFNKTQTFTGDITVIQ